MQSNNKQLPLESEEGGGLPEEASEGAEGGVRQGVAEIGAVARIRERIGRRLQRAHDIIQHIIHAICLKHHRHFCQQAAWLGRLATLPGIRERAGSRQSRSEKNAKDRFRSEFYLHSIRLCIVVPESKLGTAVF